MLLNLSSGQTCLKKKLTQIILIIAASFHLSIHDQTPFVNYCWILKDALENARLLFLKTLASKRLTECRYKLGYNDMLGISVDQHSAMLKKETKHLPSQRKKKRQGSYLFNLQKIFIAI